MTFKEWLLDNEACEDAVDWVGGRTLGQAWEDCERADWLLWLVAKNAGKRGWPSHKQVVLTACLCAETALQYTNDPRAREAIEVTKRWVAGKATLDEVKTAASTARAAIYVARAAWDAAYAADTAVYAANTAIHTADTAIHAADTAAYAAEAAAYAAWGACNAARAAVYASNRAARAASNKQMCDIIRENLSVGALS